MVREDRAPVRVTQFRHSGLGEALRRVAAWAEEPDRVVWNIAVEEDEDDGWIVTAYWLPSS